MQRRGILAIAGTVAAAGIAVPVAARADSSTTAAPSGDASAVAAQVTAGGSSVIAVGHTVAHAGSDGGSATGNAIELGGSPPSSQFGGTQKGAGHAGGSFLDTGPNSAGRLQVTPWNADVTDDGTTRTAHGDAALARLTLGDPSTQQSLMVDALQSSSDAKWTSSSSSGSSSSDGLLINAGQGALIIDLLHAEAASSGQGSSYLIGINGNQIGTSGQANGSCTLSVPSLLSLSCLTASGGNGSAASQVLTAVVGSSPTSGATGTIVGAAGSGGHAPNTGTSAATIAPAPAPAPAPAVVPQVSRSAATLPRTGANLFFDLLAGLALVALGGAVVAGSRQLSIQQ